MIVISIQRSGNTFKTSGVIYLFSMKRIYLQGTQNESCLLAKWSNILVRIQNLTFCMKNKIKVYKHPLVALYKIVHSYTFRGKYLKETQTDLICSC